MSVPLEKIDPNDIDDRLAGHLRDRPWMVEELRRQGFTEQMDAVESGEPMKHSPEEANKITTDSMRLGTQPQLIDQAQPNGVTAASDLDEVDDNYEDWTVEELKTEINTRNEEGGRTEKLSTSGNKADLAARLHADDEAEAPV